MYNAHRGMGAPANRLDEYIQGIRQEFESATARAGEHDQTCKSTKITPCHETYPMLLSVLWVRLVAGISTLDFGIPSARRSMARENMAVT